MAISTASPQASGRPLSSAADGAPVRGATAIEPRLNQPESGGGAVRSLFDRLQQRRAQRRRKDQGHQGESSIAEAIVIENCR